MIQVPAAARDGAPNVRVLNNADLAAIDAQAAQEREYERRANAEPTTRLAGYIRQCFQEAERHKTEFITPRLLKCQRQRQGEYEPDIAAAIAEQGGSDTYFNITETKCADAEAWIQDVINPAGDKPWTLEATPIPELSEEIQSLIIEEATAVLAELPPDQLSPAALQQITLDTYDRVLAREREAADERVKRHETKIEDQLTEAGFIDVLLEFIYYFATFPTAFLKGPIPRKKLTGVWKGGTYTTEWSDVLEFTAVNPFDIYPAPNAKTLHEGYVIEVMTFDLRDLEHMKGVPGWNADAIDAVLRESPASLPDATHGDLLYGASERARLESRDITDRGGVAWGTVKALDFWGTAQGDMLAEWGLSGTEGSSYYSVHSILIGRHVVYAVQNPNPTNQVPYSWASYERVPGSVWGKGLTEKMEDCQQPYSATMRNLINNTAMCAGPLISADIYALAPGQDITKIFPGKVFQYWGDKAGASARNPVVFEQPSCNVGELLPLAEYFESRADERTQIPRFAHGNDEVSGAGSTATGLSQLMNAAARGIKRVLGHIDQYVIRTLIGRVYMHNMLYGSDPSIKGDAKVVPRGVLATLVREQTQMRRQEFLQSTNNPTDLMITGIEGRARVLREVARELDMDVDQIVPDDDVILARVQAQAMQQQEQEQRGSEGTRKPQPEDA